MVHLTFFPPAELPEVGDDVRALFDDLAASLGRDQRAYSGECRPAIDVFETDRAVEIVLDASGIPPEAIRVVYRAGIVIVAGEKAPPRADEKQAFHLVEREFGRFARAVRLAGAYDVANSRASLRDGELTIVLPKMAERRGAAQRIPIG